MAVVPTAGSVEAQVLERYRRELVGYCYRMLGSIHEAEDAVQETMLRAWRALARFDDRGGLRPWLYRIATNVCLDLVKGRPRRALPVEVAPAGTPEGRLVDGRPELTWISPAPDGIILPPDGDPAEQVVSRESVRLAFIAALQHLSPRQRAVLILRDVLRWKASEVALLLETERGRRQQRPRRARAALEPIDRDSAPASPRPPIATCSSPTSTPSNAKTSKPSCASSGRTQSSRCRRSTYGSGAETTSVSGSSPSKRCETMSSGRSAPTGRWRSPSIAQRPPEDLRLPSASTRSTSPAGRSAPFTPSLTRDCSRRSAYLSNPCTRADSIPPTGNAPPRPDEL